MIRMREIKFRAWHKVREIMRNVTQITYFDDEIYTVILGDDSFACPPKDVEIMQYTGLKDKNGKDIYEGDIVSGDGMYNDVIVFKNGTFTPEGGDNDLSLEYQMESYGDSFEVIGNIYENPELLEGDKQ